MSTYSISAINLKKLNGQKFSLAAVSGKASIPFQIPAPEMSWPRTGLEAYVLPVECQHPQKGKIPSILKIFKQDIPERTGRSDFLVRLGLAKHHPWLFQGMPYASVKVTIKGVHIIGHIAKRITGHNFQANDIFRLREGGNWNFDWETRRRLAGHLCCAVYGLELLDVVHGDISPRNVVIGTAPDNKPAAILCDYDGFYHPAQPLLPEVFDNQLCRPIGTSGYQYPSLIKALDNKAQNILVQADRFALGVLICEIMVWSNAVASGLNRESLLDNEIIRRGSLDTLPSALINMWKEGFALLETSLKAKDWRHLPSPADWLKILGVPLDPEVLRPTKTFQQTPHIKISRRQGRRLVKIKTVRVQNLNGDLGLISAELQDVQFLKKGQDLILDLKWKKPVMLKRDGKWIGLGEGPCSVQIQPTDTISSNFWEMEIFDAS
jgi:hypothetical protein